MKIALVDRERSADWPGSGNRFARLAALLREWGHEVSLHDGAPPADVRAIPTLTGLNRAVAAGPMVAAYRLGQELAALNPDLVIAPLNGGLAQGVLMARACGEAFAGTRVALWCNTPSRQRFLHTDDVTTGLAPLIADALERQTLALADALIVADPDKGSLQTLLSSAGALPTIEASLPAPPDRAGERQAGTIDEIVFVGPIRRGAGIVEFIEAIRRVASDGLLGDRIVTFLGPARRGVQGIGQEWLGMRAHRWTFPFRAIETDDPAEALPYVRKQGRLAVTFVDDDEDAAAIRSAAPRAIVLVNSTAGNESLVDRTEAALRGALAGEVVARPAAPQEKDWARLVIDLAERPLRPAPQAAPARGITVCVLHHDRLTQLSRALASIPDTIDGNPVEIIVLDNASSHPSIEDEIRSRAGDRPHLRIVRLARPLPQAAALNLGLAEARFETVLFLDDDNYYLPSGVERLARAVATGGFDIVVTALDLFDDAASERAPSTGRLIFLGQAHSAGLFFNAFGDTAMAVRRDVFRRSGGFRDPGYDYPSLDWVTLARSQAAGLRIGALQSPAVRYHRDTARADMAANKLDQEGAHLLVFEAYSGSFDAELLARYAQNLQVEEL